MWAKVFGDSELLEFFIQFDPGHLFCRLPYVTRVAKAVLYACSTYHDGERIICYRAPPGVSLTFGPEAFPRGVRVVLDVDTAPLPLAVAVWDYETITDLDATVVPLGYV